MEYAGKISHLFDGVLIPSIFFLLNRTRVPTLRANIERSLARGLGDFSQLAGPRSAVSMWRYWDAREVHRGDSGKVGEGVGFYGLSSSLFCLSVSGLSEDESADSEKQQTVKHARSVKP